MEKSLKYSFLCLVILVGTISNGSMLTITPQPLITASSTNASAAFDDNVTSTDYVTQATSSSTTTVSVTEPEQKDIVFPDITASNLTLVNTSDSIWRQALDNRPSPWKGFVLLDTADLSSAHVQNSVQTSTSSFPTSHLTSLWSTTPRTVLYLPNPTKSISNLPPIYFSPSTPAPPTSGYPRPTVIPVPYGENQHYRSNQPNRDNQNYVDNKQANPNRYNEHPNKDNGHRNRYNAHPNQDGGYPNRYNTHPNRDTMHSNQDYMHPNRDSMHPNRDNMHPNRDNMHNSQAYAHPNRDKMHPMGNNRPYSEGQQNREHPIALKYPVHGRNIAVGKSYSGMPPATFSISSAPLNPNMAMAPSYGSVMSGSGPSYSATRVPHPPMSPANPMNGGGYGPQGGATGTGYETSYSHDYGSALGGGYDHMMGYGGYVAPKEDFGLKGLLGKLLTLIPIGLLLAVALPSLIVVPSRRSVSDAASGRGYVESYPILDMIRYYGVESLQDDKCLRHILCKTVKMGSQQGANVLQKHLWTVVRWMDEGLAKKMGMENLWTDIVLDECSKYKCTKTKKEVVNPTVSLIED